MFQVPRQEEEPIDSDRSMKNLIQFENNFFQSVNRLEEQMSRLINIVKERNEKTLPNTCSTIIDCPSHIDRNEESWCLGDFDQDSISSHKLNLTNSKPWTNWQVFHSMILNLNVNVTLIPNLVFSSHLRIYVDFGILTQFGPIF